MITGVAFCPHPPVLVPAVASGAAPELRDLRAACHAAITAVSRDVDALVLLGSGERTGVHHGAARGSFAGFGVELDVSLQPDGADPIELPLALTVGTWLVRDALGDELPLRAVSVGPDADSARPAWTALPALTPADHTRIGLVVMGDGSARRSTAAPGYLDERAVPFDDGVAAALKDGDTQTLTELDLDHAAQLLAAGAPVWRATATLLRATPVDGELLYYDAPFGVAYLVATWRVRTGAGG